MRVVKRMNEWRIDPRIGALLKGSPPLLERDLDDASPEPLNRFDLGFRRRLGRDHRAGDAHPTRSPGDALRHVACRRREHALSQCLCRHVSHGISSAADFE